MKFWIVSYHHNYGDDAWPVFQATRPAPEEEAEKLDNFEPEKDEYVVIHGPFITPKKRKK